MPKVRFLVAAAVIAVLALPAAASATHQDDPRTSNVALLGESLQPGSFLDPEPQRTVNSDLAFWGNFAFNGNYDGFRIIDISNRMNPQVVSWTRCPGDQGDIVVWENILVRSWNTKRSTARDCDGMPVPAGFEGVHIWDIRNKANPVPVGAVELPCGSHTATLAGVSNGRLIIYSNNSSAGGCTPQPGMTAAQSGDFMDVIAVPLANPAGASLIHREPLDGPTDDRVAPGCHDAGVFTGTVNLAVCASADTTNVFDIGANARPGGSLEDPGFMYSIREPGVASGDDPPAIRGRWHSATFSWDAKIILLGWEPGGGGEAECQATDPAARKSIFFYNSANGAKLGQWVLPRGQGGDENCTIHNYNVVPFADRHILVGGHYQAGWSAVDFTNPGAPFEFAWSDPPSLGPGPFCSDTNPPSCQLGGAWSTYWYNDEVWESDITTGFRGYTIREPWWPAAFDLTRLNPQTQERTLECTARATGTLRAKQRGQLAVSVRVLGQPAQAIRVTLRGAGVNRAAITRANGMAHFALRPQRRGVLRVNVPQTLNMKGCSTTRNVAAARKRTAPGGGGGPGLTGRA